MSPSIDTPGAVLVGDNRDNPNWGCRATSIALHHVLERHGGVSGRIGRNDVLRKDSRIPAVARFAGRGGNRLARALAEVAMQRSDYIGGDIPRNAEIILSNVKSSSFFRSLVERVERADRVVVNGEGCMVLKPVERRDVRFLLTMLELGRRLGKPGYYVNAMISDFPEAPRNQASWTNYRANLAKCQGVQTRDHASFRLLQEMDLPVPTAVLPDALFAASNWDLFPRDHPSTIPARLLAPWPEEPQHLNWSFDRPYICVSGSSYFRSRNRFADGRAFYTELARVIAALGHRCILVATCTGDAFLESIARDCGLDFVPVHTGIFPGSTILGNATAFVSGRFHPTILASLGGTPCVFMESNSHKMASLRPWLDEEGEELGYRDAGVHDRIRQALADIIDQGATLRDRKRARAQALGRQAEEGIPRFVTASA